MTDTYSVPLKTLVKEFNLEVTYASTDFDAIRITVEDVARPGLQLAGYFDHYEPMRLQVMGNVEMSYVDKLQPKERGAIFDRLFSYKFPALLIARDIPPHAECLQMAQKHNVTVLRTKEATSTIVSTIITYLKAALAPPCCRDAGYGPCRRRRPRRSTSCPAQCTLSCRCRQRDAGNGWGWWSCR